MMYIRNNNTDAFILVFCCLVFLSSCQNASPVNPNMQAEGTLVSYTDCKDFNKTGSSPTGQFSSSDSGQECIEYRYYGNVLWIKHINAAFNCCLDKICGDVTIEDNTIRIQSEGILANGQGCHCNCLYDVEYEIRDLPPSSYIILGPTFSHPIEIDLRISTSGRACEPRSIYPWH